MMRFAAHLYVKIGSLLTKMGSTIEASDNAVTSRREEYLAGVEDTVDHLITELASIGCSISSQAVKRYKRDLRLISYEVLNARCMELRESIADEMRDQTFFWVPSHRAKFYGKTEQTFGANVANNFPSSLSEIREAGNCYAFGNSTACVFHLMRVTEIGLRAIYLSLGLSFDPKASWNKFLQDWRQDHIKSNPEANVKMIANLEFYQNVRATACSVKDAWRNSTMHFDRTYNEDETTEIITAVRGFMTCVAAKLDEKGNLQS